MTIGIVTITNTTRKYCSTPIYDVRSVPNHRRRVGVPVRFIDLEEDPFICPFRHCVAVRRAKPTDPAGEGGGAVGAATAAHPHVPRVADL